MISTSWRAAKGRGTSRSAIAGPCRATASRWMSAKSGLGSTSSARSMIAAVDARAPDVGDQLAVWVHHYNWDRPHEALGGLCPIDRVCERLGKTPLRSDVDVAYDAARERIQVRECAVEMVLRKLK